MKTAITLTMTIAVFMVVFVSPVFATTLQNPLESDNFQEFLDRITRFLFWFGLALLPVLILISAFYFMTAAGNTAQIETGKRIIIYTFIGFLIIIMARGAVMLLLAVFKN